MSTLLPAKRPELSLVRTACSIDCTKDSFHVGSVGPVPRTLLENFVSAFMLVF